MPASGRIRVLHVISDTNFGGAGRYLMTLLQRTEYKDRVVAEVACPPGVLWEKLSALGVPCHMLSGGDRSLDLDQLLPLASIIRRGDYRIVHTHASLTARIAARLVPGTRIVFTKHTMGGAGAGTGIMGLLQRLLADRVICPSRAVRDQLVRAGLNQDILDLIYTGVEIPEADAVRTSSRGCSADRAKHGPVILSTGRLEREKGHEYLIQAMPRVLKRYPHARLLIAGAGSLGRHLALVTQAADVQGSVELLGFRDDIMELLRRADIFVLPSLAEALGISLLEAMAAGIPCVASDVGGIHEIITSGENGLLAPPGDAEKLALSILMVLDDPVLGRNLAGYGRETVEKRFSSRAQAESTVECYRRALLAQS